MSTVVTTSVGVKVNFAELLEIQIGSTNVLLDYDAASSLFRDLSTQLRTAEIVRVNIYCTRTDNRILGFPMSRKEAKKMKDHLDWYLNG